MKFNNLTLLNLFDTVKQLLINSDETIRLFETQ